MSPSRPRPRFRPHFSLFLLYFAAFFIGFALLDTSEYQPTIIPGDTPQIQQKLDALEAAAAADSASSGNHGGVEAH